MIFRTFPRPFSLSRPWLRVSQTVALIYLLCAFVGLAHAQSDHDVRTYLDAISRLQAQDNLVPLEQFVSTAPDGSLRNDALEWLAWREWRSGVLAKASHWSDELLAGNSQNAVGLAILASRNQPVAPSSPQQSWADDPLLVAQRALRYLDLLRQPYAMPDATFAKMKQDLAANLSGAVGEGYFQRQDYAAAQPYLRQFLALVPDDSQHLYALAIADLYGPNPDEAEGFRLLARVVNLTQGTAAGQQLASFSLNEYKQHGGSDQDWERYLQATGTRGSLQLSTSAPAIPSTSPATTITAKSTPPATNKPVPPVRKPASSKPATAADTRSDSDVPSGPREMTVPYPTREPGATGPPMSLGILIETSKTASDSRRAVINNLSDVVRHLRDDDEAFLVSFSNNVVFEEDLTSDPRSIEKAMDKIKPQRGSALLDAIAFASGHLQRIAKNSRKILLVISDGDDRSAQYSPSEALTSISASGVEIYCIGMGANNGIDEARLQALAHRTGGQAVFIGDPRQFRTATREVASDMGIHLY
jgi:hypothetical protein